MQFLVVKRWVGGWLLALWFGVVGGQAGDGFQAPEGVVEELQQRAFDFFWFESHPVSGLVKDRAGNVKGDDYQIASMAATGFGLAAWGIGFEKEWRSREVLRVHSLRTLRFVRDQMENQNGWLYHFVDWESGRRAWNCEISSIDTALFIAGALVAGESMGGEVRELANELYDGVDFEWMRTNGGERPEEWLLCHGWKPESGFLKSRWDNYSEHLILNLLALGSRGHPIPTKCWEAWERNVGEYEGMRALACGPLFTHQYSQAFVDFRGKRDASGWDYFESAVNATRMNRLFCLKESQRFKTFGPNVWGLSACDRPDGGYEAYGGPPGRIVNDGTVAPWATVASLVFTPKETMEAIEFMRVRFAKEGWGRYGFCNGLNLDQEWFAEDVIGIDLGAAILMLENYRTGLVWKWFMGIPALERAMERAGFEGGD